MTRLRALGRWAVPDVWRMSCRAQRSACCDSTAPCARVCSIRWLGAAQVLPGLQKQRADFGVPYPLLYHEGLDRSEEEPMPHGGMGMHSMWATVIGIFSADRRTDHG